MKRSVNFRLEDLPPHLRSQAERQIAADNARRLKSPLRKPTEKHPIRIPKKRTPNATELRYVKDHPGSWLYEALSFRCPSGMYTPDWVMIGNGFIECVEVKGSYRFGSQSGATAKFKECAEIYPQVLWTRAKWEGSNWVCESAGGESIRTETPYGPGDSPHVRPGACAREPQELIAAWNKWMVDNCGKCPYRLACDRSLSQVSKSICFSAWLHSTMEGGK